MGIFSKLGSAPAPGAKGQYFRDGRYRVEISRVVQGESQKGDGPFVVVEGVIVGVLVGYEKSNVDGEAISWVVMLRKGPALSNLKGFFGAACGIHPESRFAKSGETVFPVGPGEDWPTGAEDVTDSEWERAGETAVAGAGDALAGTVVIADAATVPTKRGTPFTRVVWSEDEDEDEDEKTHATS